MLIDSKYLVEVDRLEEYKLYLVKLKDKDMYIFIDKFEHDIYNDMLITWLHETDEGYKCYGSLMQFKEIEKAFLVDVSIVRQLGHKVPELRDKLVAGMMHKQVGIDIANDVVDDVEAYLKEMHKICAGDYLRHGRVRPKRRAVRHYRKCKQRK